MRETRERKVTDEELIDWLKHAPAHAAQQAAARIEALVRENAEMRKVTGPRSPLCEHFLRGQYGRSFNPVRGQRRWYCRECQTEIYQSVLIANHPDIAAELGLKEAP